MCVCVVCPTPLTIYVACTEKILCRDEINILKESPVDVLFCLPCFIEIDIQ